MSAVCEKTGTNEVRLTITVSAADFEDAMNKAYLKARKSINIPGFRKGKAPRKVIENFYSEAVFYEGPLDLVFPKAYDERDRRNPGIYPVDRPSVDVTTIGGGEDLVFTCDVTVKPEVKLGSYKGIEATRPEYNVTDDDVEDELKKDQERVARWITVEDRAVENGDRITLDYAGFCDGEQFPGGTATDQTLEVGSGRFIPGFEEQLVGMKLEEEGTVNVTFPAEYHAPDLAGKDAIFNVKIHKIEVKELPEMDDEFAKDVSDCDTLEDYKAKIRERLEKTAETRAKNELDEQLVNAVVEASEVEIPECMVNSQLDYMLQEMEYRMMYQGISMEDYTQEAPVRPASPSVRRTVRRPARSSSASWCWRPCRRMRDWRYPTRSWTRRLPRWRPKPVRWRTSKRRCAIRTMITSRATCCWRKPCSSWRIAR